MKVSYEYKGHKCPFKAKVWGIGAKSERTVLAVLCEIPYPFVTEEGRFSDCEPLPEPKVKPWTPKKVPSGIEIYHPDWAKGVRVSPLSVTKYGILCHTSDDDDIFEMSYNDLAEHGWRIYGTDEPCGEVVG